LAYHVVLRAAKHTPKKAITADFYVWRSTPRPAPRIFMRITRALRTRRVQQGRISPAARHISDFGGLARIGVQCSHGLLSWIATEWADTRCRRRLVCSDLAGPTSTKPPPPPPREICRSLELLLHAVPVLRRAIFAALCVPPSEELGEEDEVGGVHAQSPGQVGHVPIAVRDRLVHQSVEML